MTPIRTGFAAAVLGLRALVPAAHAQQGVSGMVEDLKSAPQAGVELMDFVTPGQRIALGKEGQLVLSYFASCKLETIKGGTVTIGQSESRVDGGTVRTQNRPCDPKKFAVNTRVAEAGAAMTRLGKAGAAVDETTLASSRPVFKWEEKGGSLRLLVDGKEVWSATAQKSWIEYPGNAPKLEPGIAYRIEVTTVSGKTAAAHFTIDPALKLADTLANRTVMVRN
jgi:hypothetical protein